uniref:Uncharacterized protein n=1 Tax=Oryza brachyantha TaxID=4533 RepID=J3MJL3_ORYBR
MPETNPGYNTQCSVKFDILTQCAVKFVTFSGSNLSLYREFTSQSCKEAQHPSFAHPFAVSGEELVTSAAPLSQQDGFSFVQRRPVPLMGFPSPALQHPCDARLAAGFLDPPPPQHLATMAAMVGCSSLCSPLDGMSITTECSGDLLGFGQQWHPLVCSRPAPAAVELGAPASAAS